jgi:hypothetical protein
VGLVRTWLVGWLVGWMVVKCCHLTKVFQLVALPKEMITKILNQVTANDKWVMLSEEVTKAAAVNNGRRALELLLDRCGPSLVMVCLGLA